MPIFMAGISHKTASVAVRERVALDPDETARLLALLGRQFDGAAVLSTCNRTEIYVDAADEPPLAALATAIAHAKDAPGVADAPFAAHAGDAVAFHLFRVAAGIESMVIGESEILGQVRAAFTAATLAGTHSPAISRLFHTAIRTGRAVREGTAIGRRPVSISSLAVELARQSQPDLGETIVLVIGAGEAGQLTAANLIGAGVTRTIVSSRTAQRTADVAAALNAEAVPFERRADAMADANIVISSTAAHDHVIPFEMASAVMRRRPGRPLLLIDIAVPRDIDPAVRTIPGITLYDLDELQAFADRNLDLRRSEIAAADVIVQQAVAGFAAWLRAREAAPTIAALLAYADALRRSELDRALARMEISDEDRARVDAMTASLLKKLLHGPITRLKSPGGDRHASSVRALFGLDAPGDGPPD